MIEPISKYDFILHTSAKTMMDEPRLTPIPSNIILNKVITGWGATYSEIKAKRNSIILLPHKSQIYSKHDYHKEMDHTFPVTEKAKLSQLIKHIQNSNGNYVKFLSTPEGLRKVITAIRATGGNPYQDYFLLFDESHKITKDINYRVNISMPMNDFFAFKSKAMISATPFIPSDPRFKSFTTVKVNHSRDVKKDIKLLSVNNLGAAFKEYIDNYQGKLLFVFFNTLNGINALIQNSGLQNDAHVYCSEDGVKDFEWKDFNNAFSSIDANSVAKFNFLTSSFFNGLDIKGLIEVPDVVILTDINYADFTIIDPNTDTYQILGRFRPDDQNGKDRYNSAVHIINTKHSAPVKLERTAVEDFNESKIKYEVLLDLQATTADDFLKHEVYGEALQRIKPYHNLLDECGGLDYFKYDNYLYEHRLKMCYGHTIAPLLAYHMSDLYNITEDRKIYLPEEFESMIKQMNRYSKENIQKVCELITDIELQKDIPGAKETYDELSKRFPLVIRAIDRIGYAKMEELKFRQSAISKEILKVDIKDKWIHHPMIEAVYRTFKTGISYPVADVKEKLGLIFNDFEVSATAKSTDIHTYYAVREYTGHKLVLKREAIEIAKTGNIPKNVHESNGVRMKSVRMYHLIEEKHNTINLYSSRTAQLK